MSNIVSDSEQAQRAKSIKTYRRVRARGYFLEVYKDANNKLEGFLRFRGPLIVSSPDFFTLVENMPGSESGIGVYENTPVQPLESVPRVGWTLEHVTDLKEVKSTLIDRQNVNEGKHLVSVSLASYYEELLDNGNFDSESD